MRVPDYPWGVNGRCGIVRESYGPAVNQEHALAHDRETAPAVGEDEAEERRRPTLKTGDIFGPSSRILFKKGGGWGMLSGTTFRSCLGSQHRDFM